MPSELLSEGRRTFPSGPYEFAEWADTILGIVIGLAGVLLLIQGFLAAD